jgi:ribonuclease BN (tRNA processing enzyme)
LRLTVLGTGTARPVADTAASGLLVRSGDSAVLFDCGSGIAARLVEVQPLDALDGIVAGHLHADHWIDLAPLRYLFPWGEPAPRRLPVHLPPGARPRVDALATAISERPGFFDAAFDIREYASGEAFRVGELTVRPLPVGHYVPAWSMDIRGPDGSRIVYAGDMGPSDALVELARGADLLILEATLERAESDDPRRGHLTTEEAIDHAERAGVAQALLVHYPSERRDAIAAICGASGIRVRPARVGETVEVRAGRAAPMSMKAAAS